MKNSFLETLVGSGKKILDFLRKPITKLIITLIILVFGVLYIITNYNAISSALSSIQINYVYLFLGFLFVLATVIIGTFTWWFILSWLGYKRNILGVIKGYTLSSLGKYIPGFIWQYASRSIFLQDYRIPLKSIGSSIIIEYSIITILGGFLSGVSYWVVGWQFINLNGFIKSIISIGTIFLVFIIILLPKIMQRFDKKNLVKIPDCEIKYYIFAIISNFTGWILMSFAFFFLAISLGITTIDFPISIFFHTTNFFIGNLVLPVPNGLLIRESILSYLGRDLVDQQLLIILSMLLRVFIFISEAVLTALLYTLSKFMKRND